MIGTRRDPSIVQRTVPEGKLKWLGDRIGGYRYAVHDGKEYAVDVHPSPDPTAFVTQPGEILVAQRTKELIDGTPWESTNHHRAWPVESGTYAKLAAKAEARAHKPEPPMRTWDTLAALPAMQRREPTRIPTAPESSIHFGALKANLGSPEPMPVIEIGGNQPPERSPQGIIAYLNRRGIELTLARGQLVARSRRPVRADDRALIEQAEELIVGVLRGSPVMCSICAEPAVSLAFPRAPMCAAHLEG